MATEKQRDELTQDLLRVEESFTQLRNCTTWSSLFPLCDCHFGTLEFQNAVAYFRAHIQSKLDEFIALGAKCSNTMKDSSESLLRISTAISVANNQEDEDYAKSFPEWNLFPEPTANEQSEYPNLGTTGANASAEASVIRGILNGSSKSESSDEEEGFGDDVIQVDPAAPPLGSVADSVPASEHENSQGHDVDEDDLTLKDRIDGTALTSEFICYTEVFLLDQLSLSFSCKLLPAITFEHDPQVYPRPTCCTQPVCQPGCQEESS